MYEKREKEGDTTTTYDYMNVKPDAYNLWSKSVSPVVNGQELLGPNIFGIAGIKSDSRYMKGWVVGSMVKAEKNNDILFVERLIGDPDIGDGGGWAHAIQSVGEAAGSDDILENIITDYQPTGTVCVKQTPKEKNDKQKIGFGVGLAVCLAAAVSVPLTGGASAATAAMTIGMMAPGISKDGFAAAEGPEELPDECKQI